MTEAEPEQHADSYEVLEAVPLAVLVVDRRRDIRWANDRTRQLLGEAVAGRSLMGVLRHPPLIDALDQVMGSQSQDLASAVGATVGAIEGVETPIGRDRLLIADLKRLDADRVLIALKDASAEHRLERLRSDFIANVSHELKTPIATLMGFIETLRGPAKGDRRCARALPRHHARAGRADEPPGRRPAVAEPHRAQRACAARPAASNSSEIIGRVANALSLRAADRNMRIELPPTTARWGRAVGDTEELTQVFQNLIDNAIKYGRPGTAVTVSAARIVDPVEIKAHLPGAAPRQGDDRGGGRRPTARASRASISRG